MAERLQFHTIQRSSEKSNHLPLKKDHPNLNKSQTAKILDVAINTVRKKLASYGVK